MRTFPPPDIASTEVEWFRNLDNPHTERAYRKAVSEFMRFAGIRRPKEFRAITRAHVIAWRDDLKGRRQTGPTAQTGTEK
jgi:integrase/recombinase XerD